MRKTRSDKGKSRNSYKWSFKQEIRKKITNFNKSVKKIIKNEFKRQVEFAKKSDAAQGIKRTIKEIKATVDKGLNNYRMALESGYADQFTMLKQLRDEKLSESTGKYILSYIDTNVGVSGRSISRDANFGLRAIELFKERAGNWADITSISQGISLDELSDFAEFLKSDGTISKTDNFFYEFLDEEESGISNQEVIDKILEYYQMNNINNRVVNSIGI